MEQIVANDVKYPRHATSELSMVSLGECPILYLPGRSYFGQRVRKQYGAGKGSLTTCPFAMPKGEPDNK